jgi:hypothetical protein
MNCEKSIPFNAGISLARAVGRDPIKPCRWLIQKGYQDSMWRSDCYFDDNEGLWWCYDTEPGETISEVDILIWVDVSGHRRF